MELVFCNALNSHGSGSAAGSWTAVVWAETLFDDKAAHQGLVPMLFSIASAGSNRLRPSSSPGGYKMPLNRDQNWRPKPGVSVLVSGQVSWHPL